MEPENSQKALKQVNSCCTWYFPINKPAQGSPKKFLSEKIYWGVPAHFFAEIVTLVAWLVQNYKGVKFTSKML